MPLRRCVRVLPFALALALGLSGDEAVAQDRDRRDGERQSPEQYEERMISRLADRAAEVTHTEIHRWHDELTKAYPGKIGPGLEREDVLKWFDLLAAGGKEWRKADAPNARIESLFDRVVERSGLGPVPSVRRNEFEQFATRNLRTFEPPNKKDQKESADRAFRVLDRDASGSLESAEWPVGLKTAIKQVDSDGNRRVDATEYLNYFDIRVTATTETMVKLRTEYDKLRRPGGATALPGGLPAWFTKYDTDKDGQIGLYEWREAGEQINEFLKMDLDADGLLPPGEYTRYLKKAELEEKPESEEDPLPPLPPLRQ
jgi:Ca2+-binding EF-hand superfamily protein